MTKQVAFIVGGGRGIGRGVAVRLSREGYNIALIARTRIELESTANQCRAAGAAVVIFAIDATNNTLLRQAAEKTNQQFGSIDILVCSTGFTTFAPFELLTTEELDRAIDVNYRAAVYAAHSCIPFMGKQNNGAIIFYSSFMAQQLGFPGMSPYTGAKTALNGFAKGLFEEIRGKGIKVSTLYLGMANTPLGNQLNANFGPYNVIKESDMIQVEDVVQATMFIINGGPTCCTCELVLQPQKQPVKELTKFTDTRPFPIPKAVDKTKKVALITGASKGIGKVIAERMAKNGYDLALVARSLDALEETAVECRKYGVKVISLPTDLTNTKALEKSVVDCVDQLGNLNVLINNAGVNRRRSVLSSNGEVWDQIIDTNFRAALQITRASVPYMAQNDQGARAVIYISSSVVLQPGLAGVAPYYATKHAVNGFVGGFLEDVRHLGIKASAICPGLVNTELGTKKGPIENLPPHLLIQSSDCADAVDYVLACSDSCCPSSMMIHPQVGVNLSLMSMRQDLRDQFVARSKL